MSFLAAGVIGFSGLALNSLALATTSSDPDEIRNIKITRIFTPKSLDSNDSSVVILDGYLPDGCYRLTQPEVHVNDEHKIISIQARANYFNVPCIEALVPYTQEVELGMLPGGNYRIQSGDGHQIGSLSVKKAQSKYPDDFLYAPVEDLILDQKETASDQHIATLRGRFTNSCMYIEHVDTKYFPDTIEILPVMAMRKGNCADIEIPFSVDVELDASRLTHGRMLVHTRSLNGRSVSSILNVSEN
ncbi:MAG: hypothetical protein EBU49_02685 [Proteobacteria bacterium]|nr:hypothetical protein [Pseudomonadota bacterium]